MIERKHVYNNIVTAVRADYPTAYFSPTREAIPATFPAVWVVEIDTYSTVEATTLNMTDNQRRSVFEIQVFSNKTVDALGETEAIMSIIDGKMKQMKYRKTSQTPIDNAPNADIKRLASRYTRFIGDEDTI